MAFPMRVIPKPWANAVDLVGAIRAAARANAPLPPVPAYEENPSFKEWVSRTGAVIIDGMSPVYSVRLDKIFMPSPDSLRIGTHSYESALLHELAHWTGTRVDRKTIRLMHKAWGEWLWQTKSNAKFLMVYRQEETIAELTSAILADDLGLHHCVEWHADYISGCGLLEYMADALPLAIEAAEYLKSRAGDRL